MVSPIVGIPCDSKVVQHEYSPFHAVGEKYVTAIVGGAECVPILLPALGDMTCFSTLLALVDGLLLTGSLSNIQPHYYGGEMSLPGTLHDPARDKTTLPLIRLALAQEIPLLGICRGFQEMNVALGGELYQRVQDEPAFMDHREPETSDLEVCYGLRHRVHFTPGSLLQQWTGQDSTEVNSLHQQGIKRLAEGLTIEAIADDGLIEAFRVSTVKHFAFAVQWHPEWKYGEYPVSRAIFSAFGEACWARRQRQIAL